MASRSLLMFGVTGESGSQTLQQALDRGFKVTVVVRNPDRLKVKHENLEIVTGDGTDRSTFDEAMKGKDAVVSCIGSKYQYFGTVELYSKSIKAIHESMRENDVKRGVFMSSWGTVTVRDMSLTLKISFHFVRTMLNDIRDHKGSFMISDDMKRMEDYLESSGSDIDFTVVRAPGLRDGPMTSSKIIVQENGYYISRISNTIMRADVARFILSCLDTDQYNKKMVAIGVENN